MIVTNITYASGTFTATVKNQGSVATPTPTATVSAAIIAGCFVDSVYKASATANGPLAAGASVTISMSCPATSGTHTFTANANFDNRFAESDTSNNQLSKSITVGTTTNLPDVIVTNITYATNGTFTATVKNQGAAATPSGVYLSASYRVDGGYKSYGSIMGPLAAGASVTLH